MKNFSYKAFVVREDESGNISRCIEEKSLPEIKEGEVQVKVSFAALNYKDALSASGHKGITRNYPHTPGVDAAGIVIKSKSTKFNNGDKVIVTSYDFGMNTSGGFQEYITVPEAWPVHLPKKLSLEESMILGTGGFTAALALYKMEQNDQAPEMGPIVVTGATGGVGSMAVALLASRSYSVIASSGKKTAHNYLKKLGATSIVSREEVNDSSGKPLLKSKWAGAIDTVGDNTLATCVKACGRNGNIAVCGLVQSPKLETTVYPFILNGVNLLGIETAETPREVRLKIWELLASDWKIPNLDEMKNIIPLESLEHQIEEMLSGQSQGRVLVSFES